MSKVIPLGELHLRWLLREYVEHYNKERNHQSLGNELIDPDPALLGGTGEIRCRKRLGGLLRFYYRAAA